MSFSLAQYNKATFSTTNSNVSATPDTPDDGKKLHEWLMFGVRGAFRL